MLSTFHDGDQAAPQCPTKHRIMQTSVNTSSVIFPWVIQYACRVHYDRLYCSFRELLRRVTYFSVSPKSQSIMSNPL